MNTALSADFSQQARDYQERGYCIFERIVSDDLLEGLRSQCQSFMDAIDAEMDALGIDQLRLNQRGQRYFVGKKGPETPALRRYLLSDTMADVVRTTVGDSAYLFYDQYVVKAGDTEKAAFAWHQDSAYVHFEDEHIPHKPTTTVWCALDDVSEENGTIYVLPYDRAGTRDLVPHVKHPELEDRVGYTGDDPGDAIVVPAGTIVCFSSTILHRSGANKTGNLRRVYICDYSPEPIYKPRTQEPLHHDVPFLRDGEIVTRP